MLTKLFSFSADRRFTGETVEKIPLFLRIDDLSEIFISFYSMCSHVELRYHSVQLYTSNQIRFDDNFSCQWEISVSRRLCFFLIDKKTKKIDSSDFSVGFFALIDFCLILETGHNSISSMKIIFARL